MGFARHIEAGYFLLGFLIDSFGSYFLIFSFAFVVDMDNLVDVDNIEEVAIVVIVMVEEFNMGEQYSTDTFQKNYYLLVDIRFLCIRVKIAVFVDTDHLNFLENYENSEVPQNNYPQLQELHSVGSSC